MDILCRFEYLGKTLEITTMEEEWPVAAMPDLAAGAVREPADVTLGPITLSAPTLAAGDTLTLSAQVGGKDVVSVFLELLLRDPAAEQYYGPVYREPIASPRTKTVGGVVYPDWGEVPVAQVTIQPFQRLLTDGEDWAMGFLKPTGPRGTGDEPVYTLEALYKAGWRGKQRHVRLLFDGAGAVTQVLGLHDVGAGEAPRPFTPRRGDRFTPLLRFYRPAGAEGSVAEKAVVQGNTIKWRARGLLWKAAAPIPGAYLVGLVAEDLDGQLHRRYTAISIK